MRMRCSLVLSLAALAATPATTSAQGLLRDVKPGTAANPAPLRDATILGVLGPVAVVHATDDVGGARLWRTDGTDSGTYPFAEIAVANLATSRVWNGSLYFFGATSAFGTFGFYRTDGTRTGTTLLRAALSPVFGTRVFDVGPDGRLWFFANEASTGVEVWATDGTPTGTQIVVDMLPGSGSGIPATPQVGAPLEMCAAAGFVFFPARTTSGGPVSMWRSDGTIANTLQVSSGPGGIKGHAMEAIGGLMVYAAEDGGGGGSTLYRTDGSHAGTVQLLPSPFGVLNHAVVNGRYVFNMASSTIGNELFTTDGFTVVGVVDLNPGLAGSFPRDLTVVGNTLYFNAEQPTIGRELYRTDGTSFNWSLVADINFALPSTNFGSFGAVGNELWFTTDAGGLGYEPWRSAGTPPTTVPVANLESGAASSNARGFTQLGTGALFVADVGGVTGRLYWSDGTAAGTRALLATAPLASNPADFTSSRGLAFFTADEPGFGREPFVSDGTPAGTVRLADTAPGAGGISATRFTTCRDFTWFVANGSLWRSLGTPATTTPVLSGLASNSMLAATSDALYVTTTTTAVLRVDGATLATSTLMSSTPSTPFLIAHGDRLAIVVGSGTSTMQVWTSDGTVAGTTQVMNVQGNPARVLDSTADEANAWLLLQYTFASFPFQIPVHQLVRIGSTGVLGFVRSANPPSAFSPPAIRELTPFLGECWFVDSSDNELWRSNGTGPATSFADLRPGSVGSNPTDLTAVGGLLYFVANDGITGQELWRTDGTLAGTFVLEATPGIAGVSVKNLFAAADGETLVFARADADGYEVWHTNGTTPGAKLLDVNVGVRDSDPSFGAVAESTLVFAANDGITGREPWATPLAPTAAVLARPHGVPCGHPGGSRPHIGADGLPRVGNLGFAFTLRDAAPFQLCGIFVGVGRIEIPTPAGCTLQLDQVGLPFAFTDAAGSARVACSIPNDPYFVGFALAAQFAAIDPPSGPGRFTLSDGLDVLLGL